MLVYQRVSSKTIKNRDGKFSGWRKSDQLWPVHWASVELSQVSTLLQLGNRPHPPGGRQKPWRDMPRPRGRKHKHCYCCSISDAILGWKILDYSDYSYTFWSSNLTCWKKKKRHFESRPSWSACRSWDPPWAHHWHRPRPILGRGRSWRTPPPTDVRQNVTGGYRMVPPKVMWMLVYKPCEILVRYIYHKP